MLKRVAVIGHSIVRDLRNVGELSGNLGERDSFKVDFFCISGSCFRTWLDWPAELNSAIDFKPDYLFIIL